MENLEFLNLNLFEFLYMIYTCSDYTVKLIQHNSMLLNDRNMQH